MDLLLLSFPVVVKNYVLINCWLLQSYWKVVSVCVPKKKKKEAQEENFLGKVVGEKLA